ncbi:2-acylglycerol O-acyltransferase 1 isoform X2 [Cephus cinctus]|nr:2-acylglycerol O-acyltransferase 1 isoform X2 [Cephus cinctus]
MQLLGVKFAPLNIPLERRLQTLAAAAWIIIPILGSITGLVVTIYLLLFTQKIRYFVLIYLIWIYYDRDTCNRGGRGEKYTTWMRNCAWWRYFCAYFPLKLVKTADLDPSRNYLFCSFPHGILSTGAFGAFATDCLGFKDLFPGLEPRMLTLDQHFKIPFFREFVYSFGACSASAESIDYLTGAPGTGRAAVLVVGGASESLRCKPGTYRIILTRRKGFVRIALKNGTPLVPVFSFGETDLYDQFDSPEGSWLRKVQESLKKLTGVAPVLLIGRGLFQYSFGVVPLRKPVTVVVGSPIELPKISEPTKEQVNEYHAKFAENLIKLFEEYKYKYLENPEKVSLVIE